MTDQPVPFANPRSLDSAALRALAHPLRVRILDELSMYGPHTASGLGERLGESSGATSYHLRQLEKHGLVREDVDRGTARERWWMRVPGAISAPPPMMFPTGSADQVASRLIQQEWNRSREANFHAFFDGGAEAFPARWQEAATANTVNLALTHDEFRAMVVELESVLSDYVDRYRATPSTGAVPVQFQLNAFPLAGGVDAAQAGDATPTGDVGGAEDDRHE